jgi:hypothetical protein
LIALLIDGMVEEESACTDCASRNVDINFVAAAANTRFHGIACLSSNQPTTHLLAGEETNGR